MPRLFAALLTVFALAAPATASAATAPYYTDAQAERHLEHVIGSSWFCINGYYSKREQRTGHHLPQSNSERFRSFMCVNGDHADRYVQTRPHGRWVIMRDR